MRTSALCSLKRNAHLLISYSGKGKEEKGERGRRGGAAAAEGFWLLGQTHGHDETRREKQPADQSNSPCDKKNPRKETEERGFGSLAFGRI